MIGESICQVFLPEDRGLHSLPYDQDFLDFPEINRLIITKKSFVSHIH